MRPVLTMSIGCAVIRGVIVYAYGYVSRHCETQSITITFMPFSHLAPTLPITVLRILSLSILFQDAWEGARKTDRRR